MIPDAEQRARYAAWPNLAAMVLECATRLGDHPFLWAKRGTWQPVTGAEAVAQAKDLARGLMSLGLMPGERVLLVSEGRPEFPIADAAIMAAGAITVPAYTTNTPADHRHILDDCTPKIAIVSTRALAVKVLAAAAEAAMPPLVVVMEPLDRAPPRGVTATPWDEVLATGRAAGHAPLPGIEAGRAAVACIIYTSGTGGVPKGVMLTHGNILHNCLAAYDLLAPMGLNSETFLSFLPLSHSYEHTAGQFFPISIGAQIYYAEGIDRLSANLTETRPTIMTAVPRLYELMRGKILATVERQGGVKARLFHAALDFGLRRDAGRLGPLARLADPVLDRLVRAKVAQRFGGRLKAMVSGGAPLNPDVGRFFMALGIQVLQGYGQTEAAPVISCNPPGRVRIDTVGPALVDVEVRIAGDGEILVRGPLVMRGYWNQPEATAATIDGDGWLHTGDIGEIDPDGYIRITDRKKDIIVNSGGDNIAPQRIEGLLTLEPEIAQAMVHGDRRPHLVALVVPDEAFVKQWSAAQGRPADPADKDFRKALGAAIDRVNRGLSPIEKVRRFAIAPEPFSVANELLTPTLKVRRHKIRERFGTVLDGLYEG